MIQSFYTQLFAQPQTQGSQMRVLAQITQLSNEALRSLAGNIVWSIWS